MIRKLEVEENSENQNQKKKILKKGRKSSYKIINNSFKKLFLSSENWKIMSLKSVFLFAGNRIKTICSQPNRNV